MLPKKFLLTNPDILFIIAHKTYSTALTSKLYLQQHLHRKPWSNESVNQEYVV